MDAFFVSVELRRRPDLRGRPVVVATGTDPQQRGVVMAASYEARKFGVHSALPLTIAHRKCPDAVLLPRDMALYSEVSREVMAIIRRQSDLVEVAGLDEAYVDLTGEPLPQDGVPADQARGPRGDGPCLLDRARPQQAAGQDRLGPRQAGRLLPAAQGGHAGAGRRPARVADTGRGPEDLRAVAACADRDGRPTCERARRPARPRAGPAPRTELRRKANGDDNRSVTTNRERKSESCETTFARDVSDRGTLLETLDRLADRVCEGLARHRIRGRTVTLKIRLRPFRTYTRSLTLESPTRDAAVVTRDCARAARTGGDRHARAPARRRAAWPRARLLSAGRAGEWR